MFTGTGGVYNKLYPWFFSSVFFGKFSSLNYTGWLTLDERAFARLYPGNHEVAKHLGRRRKSEAIYGKKLHVPRLFYKIALRVAWQANRLISRSARRRGGQESIELWVVGWGIDWIKKPPPRCNWVFILYQSFKSFHRLIYRWVA